MENKETLDTGTPISYASSYFKVIPINDKVATVRPAGLGEILKWKTSMREASSARARAFVCKESNMIVIPYTFKQGRYPQFDFNSWSELYAYAVRQANVDLVYDEFVEAVREALPECSAAIDEELSGGTKEALEGKRVSPETSESSGIELSEDEIKLGVSKDIDELITRIMDIATNETINEVLSLINNTCNKENDVLSIDWEIVELETVFRLDLTIEIVKWGSKKPEVLKTMGFFPLMGYF